VAAIKEQEQDWQDRLDDLQTKRREALVTSIISQLCGGIDQRPVYLFSRGIEQLDKGAINRILARAGVQLKSKATVSERRVRITLDDGRQVEHSVFWLSRKLPEGVTDEDAEAEDRAEAPAAQEG
jgi:hypothetical protein